MRQFELDSFNKDLALQIDEWPLDLNVIDRCTQEDVATLCLDAIQKKFRRSSKVALRWPAIPPDEGKGVLMGVFPCTLRSEQSQLHATFQLFFAITPTRTVTKCQITTLIRREPWVSNSVPLPCDLGGISGGPIVGLVETRSDGEPTLPSLLSDLNLSGIIVEHPDYGSSDFTIERIVGRTLHSLAASGKFVK